MKLITGIIAMIMSTALCADSGSQPQVDGCIVAGSQVQLMEKLHSETYPKLANNQADAHLQPETYWILLTDKTYCGEGYNPKTKNLYRLEQSASKFQLILKPEQYDDQNDLLGKKVIVEGKMILGKTQHHTTMLIDVNSIEAATCNPGSVS